jgi:V-type H+-transporting ATPase subunit D
LKKVSAKKKGDAAAEEAIRQEKKAAEAANAEAEPQKAAEEAVETKDVLGDEDNQDVII